MSFRLAEDYLLQHAYRNVWCTPDQDRQGILELAKITPQNGVFSYFTYQWRTIALPVKRKRFHVYQIGQVHPGILGLYNNRAGWVPATMSVEMESVLIQPYNGRGTMVSLCRCWYLVTGDNNLLLAVQDSTQREDLTDIDFEEPLFLRLYSNAYFEGADNNSLFNLKAKSMRVGSQQEIVDLQNEVSDWSDHGVVISYVNGRIVEAINPIVARPGDYVDVICDTSVKYIIDYSVNDLREFNSELDSMRKYLLTHDENTNTIDYLDDVDMYLIASGANGKGSLLHRNDSRTIRQLTHRDWSVAIPRVDGTAQANDHLRGKDLKIRMYVRHSGYKRELVFENSRIFELYRLPAQERLDAMLGINAHVDVWRAENLEKSAYVAIMGAESGTITKKMVQEAYGYNALSILLGNTPTDAVDIGGNKVIFIPEGLRGNASIYEYDREGMFLGFGSISIDNTYTLTKPTAAFAEVLFGTAGLTMDVQTQASGIIESDYNYRFYYADAINGIRTGEWVDATGTAEYHVSDGQFQWVRQTGRVWRVVSNKRILSYTTEVGTSAGVLEFDLVHSVNGQYERFDIPVGRIDIFVNGFSLIENLDFVVTGSRVTILSKKYLKRDQSGKEKVTVRCMGLARKNMQRDEVEEASFVNNGYLSDNDKYDVRQDRVLRIIVDGRVRKREDLEFAEDGVVPRIAHALNGAPYQISDIVVPMNRYLVDDGGVEDLTYELRAKSREIDAQVSDYLSLKHPQDPVGEINAIAQRHALYSPFLARILDDLITGVLWEDRFVEHFGDDYIREICKPYEHLLQRDPASGVFAVDKRYVVVHPHIEHTYRSVTMYQWRVLQRIRDLYTPDVDLSSHVSVLQF